MEAAFQLRLLGPARIVRDGESLLTAPKLLALLGYLAVEEGPVPREHLADSFWGDKPEERGRILAGPCTSFPRVSPAVLARTATRCSFGSLLTAGWIQMRS